MSTTFKQEIFIFLSLLTFSYGQDYQLTILHTNDVHARFEETNAFGGPCESDCFGGVARRYTAIQEIRQRHENVLLLDAGDQFQGTLWFNYYQGNATKHFIRRLGYDVIALGNHEFDNGIKGLSAYLKNLGIDVVSSNLDSSRVGALRNLYTPSTVKNIGGRSVGIIGYVTELTPLLVKPDGIVSLRFNKIVESIKAQVDRLKARGVNIIIALGHAGYEFDLRLAQEVPDLDLIIGGHTNTFLYNGDPPSRETPVGPYPTLVPKRSRGATTVAVVRTEDPEKVVPVVQAFTNGKYLGYLNLTFDDEGNLQSWRGNPLLLDSKYQQDPTILAEVEAWKVPLEKYRSVNVGNSLVYMEGYSDYCRLQECNMGNMVTDAMVDFYLSKLPGTKGWANVSVALWNAGGFVNSFKKGRITRGDVEEALPYRNTVERVEVKGTTLWEIVEHSISKYDLIDPSGRFLHYSGLKVVYDVMAPKGSRVESIHVLCASCDVPTYSGIVMDKMYSVLMNDFLIQGGDGYNMLANNVLGRLAFGDLISDVIAAYIRKYSPLKTGVEGRITVKDETAPMVTPTIGPNGIGLVSGEVCSSASILGFFSYSLEIALIISVLQFIYI